MKAESDRCPSIENEAHFVIKPIVKSADQKFWI